MIIRRANTTPEALQPVAQSSAPMKGPRYEFNGKSHIITDQTSNEVLFVCDPPSHEAFRAGFPLKPEFLRFLHHKLGPLGIKPEHVSFISLCNPVPPHLSNSAKKEWDYVSQYVPGVQEYIKNSNPRVIVPFGSLASRAVFGRAVKITKARGMVAQVDGIKPPVLPMLSPSFVSRLPEHMPTFEADLGTLSRFKRNNYDPESMTLTTVDYRWVHDLDELLSQPKPKALAVDTETTGLTWWSADTKVLVVQLTAKAGQSFLCPVSREYLDLWFPGISERSRSKLLRQLKLMLEDPDIAKIGHNAKFDHMMLRKLGINVQNWRYETQLMAFGVDENMMSKSLDDCVRIWVPEMSGYSDAFDQTVDKNDMLHVPPEDVFDADGNLVKHGMRMYAGGDSDAAFRLARALYPLLRADAQQWNIYDRVQLGAIIAFANRVERFGMKIDQEALYELGSEVNTWMEAENRELTAMVPSAVRLKHIDKGLSFTRDDFLRDVLFSEDGFKLKPRVFTASTAEDPDPTKRVPSVSTKDHLPYFVTRKDKAGEFVLRLTEYQKTAKMKSTYCDGFWKYISPSGHIFPSYMLHNTNTGRTASNNPNGQNYPKRGRWAKKFLKIFKPNDGFRFVAADLSQIELRIAAWESMDPVMLEIYRNNGDIHTMTAAASMRLTIEQFKALPKAEQKLARFRAKAINFGFIYGMSSGGFQTYAKTQYGVDYTEEEAADVRSLFFQKYKALPLWHERRKEEARQYGQVRALHGAVRHLPSIYSDDRAIVAMAERQGVNAPVQRFGSDLGVMALTRISWQADPDVMRPVGFVHDQVICEARIGYEREAAGALVWAMQNPPLQEWFSIQPPIPILAEPDFGPSLGETIDFGELPVNDAGELALPSWVDPTWQTVNEGGKFSIPLTIERPEWWNTNEEEARQAFMVHLRN